MAGGSPSAMQAWEGRRPDGTQLLNMLEQLQQMNHGLPPVPNNEPCRQPSRGDIRNNKRYIVQAHA